MNLEYSRSQQDFRREVSQWLAENVPDQPLQSFDTELGFQQHRD